jgi:hypothetical protein
MWEARSTWHCSKCDNQIAGKDANCGWCSARTRIRALESVLRRALPYVRLYAHPQDSPDFETDSETQAKVIKQAEKLLAPPKRRKSKGRRVMKRVLSAIVFVVSAAVGTAEAQVYNFDRMQLGDPVDGRPGCTWQWAQNTVGPWGGWYQACDSPQPQQKVAIALPEAIPPQHACQGLNPYTDPSGMMACIAAQPVAPPPSLPPIHVGRRYFLAYSSLQVHVLSLGTTLDGATVVTYQWLVDVSGHTAGDVSSCRYDGRGTPNTCAPFVPM